MLSNLRISPSKTTAKAGEKVLFTLTWDGFPEYTKDGVNYVGDLISVRGAGGLEGTVSIRRDYFSYGRYQFYATIPKDWYGQKDGYFSVDWVDSRYDIVAEVKSASASIQVKGLLNPTVSLSPSNPTIRPGESAVFDVNVSGVEAPFTVKNYKWTYATLPIGGNTPALTIPWSSVGYEFVLCDVTVEKDGFDPVTVRGDTKLTMAQGTMDGVSVMISGAPPSLKLNDIMSVNALVSGAPAQATINYEWKVNGYKRSSDNTLEYRAHVSDFSTEHSANVQVIVSVLAPNYDGVTIESPIIKIPVEKFTPEDIYSYVSSNGYNSYWGPKGEVNVSWHLTYSLGNPSYNFLKPVEDQPIPVVKLDGVVLEEVNMRAVDSGHGGRQYTQTQNYLWPSLIGIHEYETTILFQEDEWFTGGPITVKSQFAVDKNPNKDVYFLVDEKPLTPGTVYYIKASMGQELKFSIRNIFDAEVIKTQSNKLVSEKYKSELTALGKTGKFELIDFQGNVAATAIDGVFTYTTPAEVKVLKGKIRHTIDDVANFKPNPYVAEQDIEINIVANPMVPMPTLKLTQTPSPVTLGQYARIERSFTDIPDGSNIDESKWFVNQSAFGTSSDISVTGEFDKSIRNNTFVYPTNFDPAVLTADLMLNVALKPWPVISLDLMPARTTVPWGEFLIAGYDVIGEEVLDDQDKLAISTPVWYLDGTQLQTIAGDGSLMIRATHPGNHVIKAVVTLRHPDYENGEKVVEQSFNMTTEKREMATVLTLLPADAVVGIGKTQKFTATVTGAPADATTTYVWTVDGVAQSSTANNMDYTATTEGTKKIKVVSTTKAQDAEDDVQEKTVDLVVNKNVMALTVVASTDTSTVKIGDSYTIKCDVTGQPAGATIAYKWDSGETTQSVTKASTAVGPIARKCTVTVKAQDYEDAVIDSNTVTVQVQKKDQTTKAVASTTTPSINQLQNYTADVEVTDSPAGATITYLWSTGETTKSVSKKAEKSGQIKLKCTVTVKAADYEDKVITTNELTIDVARVVVPGVVVTIESTPADVEVDEEYSVTCAVEGYPVGSAVDFTWDSGEKTATIKKTQTTEGDYTHSCVVKVSHADFNTSSTTKEVTVNVKAKPIIPGDECPLIDVHPLPHRGTAYIWCGWWVMREIERLTNEGKDWKNATSADSKYYCHLNVLAKMLVDYPEVDVQESRNGYIVHRSALELGIIY